MLEAFEPKGTVVLLASFVQVLTASPIQNNLHHEN